MPTTKTPKASYTINDLPALFYKHLGITIGRQGVYHYINHFGFPHNTGWGRPRLWIKKEVDNWFKKQKTCKS